MNAYAKVAQAVIRLIAFALIVISLLLFVSDRFVPYFHDAGGMNPARQPPTPVPSQRPSVPWPLATAVLAGLVLLWKSRALAARLTRDLD